jgi:hypothetical protein
MERSWSSLEDLSWSKRLRVRWAESDAKDVLPLHVSGAESHNASHMQSEQAGVLASRGYLESFLR